MVFLANFLVALLFGAITCWALNQMRAPQWLAVLVGLIVGFYVFVIGLGASML